MAHGVHDESSWDLTDFSGSTARVGLRQLSVVPEMDGNDVAFADDRQGRADANCRMLLQVAPQVVVKRQR